MSAPLRLVADENIPLVREAFGSLGAVTLRPGRQITPADVRRADALLVRSVTPVGPALLGGSAVRFVGSATIGTDHVARDYLREQGIAFAHAPGSNAESVVEYVLAALLHLAACRGSPLRGKRVGIVGCGHIGGQLAGRLPAFGVRVLSNDPPLAAQALRAGRAHDYVSLDDVLAEADIVTLHVPLTRGGPYATHHLLDQARLRRLRSDAWLVNTCRGPVVDNAALRALRAAGGLGGVVLDVWEHEPTPDPALLHRVDLATPHIAGYSYDGKVQGTIWLYEALTEHFGLPSTWSPAAALAPGPEDRLRLRPPDPGLGETAWLHALVQQMYDLAADDAQMRDLLAQPENEQGAFFGRLRRQYPRRRAFSRHRLPDAAVPPERLEAVRNGLRVMRDA